MATLDEVQNAKLQKALEQSKADAFVDKINNLSNQKTQQQGIRQQQINNSVNAYEQTRPDIDKAYKQSAQQSYIRQQQSLNNLPQRLKMQGINGGLSETSHLRVNNQYGNEMSNAKETANTANTALDRAISGIKSQGELDKLSDNLNYDSQIGDAQVNQNIFKGNSKAYGEYQIDMNKLYEQQKADELAEKLRQEQIAYAKAKAEASKPRITAAQAKEAYMEGNTSQGVMDAMNYYYGGTQGLEAGNENYNKSSNKINSETLKNINELFSKIPMMNINQLKSGIEQSYKNGKLSDKQVYDIVVDNVKNSKITDEEAVEFLNKLGISI